MLSQKAKYALRAVLMLAEDETATAPTAISAIAERERISQKFLEAILVELRNKGFLTSRRGRLGGYRLARPADDISFGDIIRAIDGPLAPIHCASRTQFKPCEDCADIKNCSIRWAMIRARDAIAEALDGCSLAQALRREHEPVEEFALLTADI
jgi:Rrf2 family protein